MKWLVAGWMVLCLFIAGVGEAVAEDNISPEELAKIVVEQKIEERIEFGFHEFEGLSVGLMIPLFDIGEEATYYLVELHHKDGELGGYMIVDVSDSNFVFITEFAAGDVHPYQDISSSDPYYFGHGNYAYEENEILIDMRTEQPLNKEEITFLKKEKKLKEEKSKEDYEEDVGDLFAPQTIISRTYYYISGVGDPQQSDSGKSEFCAPTAGANVMMYWKNNGYSKLASSTNWKPVENRLGTLMKWDSKTGTKISNIAPGERSYIKEKGYKNFSVSTVNSPAFSKLETQTKNKRPPILVLKGYNYNGNHAVVLVGTEKYHEKLGSKYTWYYNIVVRDQWKSTPKDVWFNFGRGDGSVSHMISVIP
ncbi:hypothetical protein SAMN05421736_106200 [Evansella caseinilytica]|uniref:Peptidase C39-like protein n=1 Tax=Evansella caseinilytica TaxID=1503961 RepID=A0A1H3QI71_9BACI|nr:hypothetical protein [Evansella caseinilytica]SDZ13222.1 hypothetical protein SAMN05421736_106200 [Evansella caseinilytica]